MIRKFWESNDNQEDVIKKEIEEASLPNRIRGKIIHLNDDEGYGFIESKEESLKFRRIYFHWTGLLQDTKTFEMLNMNDELEFTPVEGAKGWKALFIKVI